MHSLQSICISFTVTDPPAVVPLSAYITSFFKTLTQLNQSSIEEIVSKTFPQEEPFQRTKVFYMIIQLGRDLRKSLA